MKYTFSIIILFQGILMFAQNCTTADASIWQNTWSSCTPSTNPNSAHGSGHWILYDLGENARLGKTQIWNTNEASKLDEGFKEVYVDYSTNGTTWTRLGEYVFEQGTGVATYGGFEGPNFQGKEVRYVLITAKSNYGNASCYGLCEVKFNAIPKQIQPKSGVALKVKILLQGTFQSGLMGNELRTNQLLSYQEPYSAMGLYKANSVGGENAESIALGQSGQNAIVDWVFLELRHQYNSKRILATRSALVQRDGDVVDTDGSSPVFFEGINEGDYYVAVRHRNHLGVMTSAPIRLE